MTFRKNTTIMTVVLLSGILTLVPINASADIDDNLVAYFGFDGNTDDYSGNNNDGTVTSTEKYASGPIGTAFDFDGASYVTLANESNFDFERTDSISFSFWVNTDTTHADAIISKLTNIPTGYVVRMDDGVIVVQLINTWTQVPTTNAIWITAGSGVNDATWNHVTVTYDGTSSASGIKVYVDGELQSNTILLDTLSNTILNDQAVIVGSNVYGNHYTEGLDDVRIYDVELTAAQITEIYEQSPFVLIEQNTVEIESNDSEIDDLYDFWDDLRASIITWLAGRP